MDFLLLSLIKAAVVAFVLLTALAYLQWIERKVIAHIQLRVGPYRVGPHGLLQPLADVVKLITKEGVIPSHVNKLFYLMAPWIAVVLALISIAVIPFGPQVTIGPITTWMQLTDLRIGILFVLAVSSIGVYGVALGGWASNNKYSLLGGLRSSAQMISYELPLGLAVAAPLLLANTLSFREMVNYQEGFWLGFIPRWNFIPEILGFTVFIIAGFAETNRVPFDLPEAENELVAGFHTEYSSMKFAAFFMAEYANMVRVAAAVPRTLLRLRSHPGIRAGRFDRRLSRSPSGAAQRQVYVTRRGCDLSRHCGPVRPFFAGSCFEDHPDGAVLVLRQDRHHSVFVHLGAWHQPALPIRPVDAFCLDFPVPAGHVQPAYHEFGRGPFQIDI
jgi:NADH-quinone oxidoreductase subunit H